MGKGQVEIRDNHGETVHVNGTYTALPVNVPASDAGFLSEVLIDVLEEEDDDDGHLLVSFDDGTTFKKIYIGGFLVWTPKGDVKHLVVKTSSGSIDAEFLVNRESL